MSTFQNPQRHQVCPVCKGTGTVENVTVTVSDSSFRFPATCKKCGGTGSVDLLEEAAIELEKEEAQKRRLSREIRVYFLVFLTLVLVASVVVRVESLAERVAFGAELVVGVLFVAWLTFKGSWQSLSRRVADRQNDLELLAAHFGQKRKNDEDSETFPEDIDDDIADTEKLTDHLSG